MSESIKDPFVIPQRLIVGASEATFAIMERAREAIRVIHYQNIFIVTDYAICGDDRRYEYAACGRCNENYPCATLRALDEALEGS